VLEIVANKEKIELKVGRKKPTKPT